MRASAAVKCHNFLFINLLMKYNPIIKNFISVLSECVMLIPCPRIEVRHIRSNLETDPLCVTITSIHNLELLKQSSSLALCVPEVSAYL